MANQKIRKVVIPVAGTGTRMLPVTKAQPKEMLPVLDKPAIQYIVEEAVAAGITDIILVTGATKRAIEDHFDRNEALEQACLNSGKEEYYEKIKAVAELANFIYIRQKGPYGTGTPVLNAEHLIGNEPFAVIHGDEIYRCPKNRPHLKQLIEVFEHYGDPVITAMPTDSEGTKKYGMIEGVKVKPDIYEVKRVKEKPGPQGTKSRIASLGGYILTPDIFDALRQMPKKKGREFILAEAIDFLRRSRPIYAKLVDGTYHDTGSKLGWLETNIEFALQDKEVKGELRKFLLKKLK